MKRFLVVLGVLFAGLAFADGAQAQNYVRDGFGKCMHVPEESRANGVQLRTWDCLDKAHLKWEKVPLLVDTYPQTPADANLQYFWLKNNLTGKCAAVHKGKHQDGSPVVQWDCEGSVHFQWALYKDTGQIIHRESEKCLRSASGDNYAPMTIQACAALAIPESQQWKQVQWSEEDPSLLMSGNGKCMHVPYVSYKNGTQLTTWDCNKELKQLQWRIQHPFTTARPFYWFRNELTNKCMAVHAGQNREGAWVIQWDCQDGEHFQWNVMDLHEGYQGRQIQHRASGMCLRVASSARNSPATLAPCAQVPSNMKWTIGG